ncbi:MAG TPA: hypothetical protein EYH06_12030 [Chromatiales bacterium]|nr:hypothetical protein [Chromatiales bacterium]
MHEERRFAENSGKAGWPITRRSIAFAMVQGGSASLLCQIFCKMVQAQTVFLQNRQQFYSRLTFMMIQWDGAGLRAICELMTDADQGLYFVFPAHLGWSEH